MTSNEEPRPDRLHTFSRQVLEAKYREQCQHNADLRDELRQLGAQNESLHAALMEAEERRAAYEAGADATPPAEGVARTPGQLWHKLLSDTEDGRLAFLVAMLESNRTAHACLLNDHQGRIDALTYDLTDVQVRLERVLRLGGPRPVTALVTAVEALRQVMVDGIAARADVLATDDELPDEGDFPQERDTAAKIGEQLKSAGIDTRSVCNYEWPGDELHDHVCGVVNPLHAQEHLCPCSATLSHMEAEKLAEAGR